MSAQPPGRGTEGEMQQYMLVINELEKQELETWLRGVESPNGVSGVEITILALLWDMLNNAEVTP